MHKFSSKKQGKCLLGVVVLKKLQRLRKRFKDF